MTHSVTTNYTYDGLNRLTQETQTGAGAFTNTYTYDDFSNRSQAVLAGATTRYFYDANNRLLTSSGDNTATSYTYDAQGNMTRADLTVSGDTALMLYCTYDGFNRLKEVGDKDSKMVYTYDADGLRTSKKGDKASEQYVYDGDQLVVKIGKAELSNFTMPASGNTSVLMPELIANKRYYAVINGRTYSAVAKYVMGETDYPVILANSEPDSVNSRSDERPEIPPVTEDNRILLEFGPINMEMVGPEYPTVDGNRYVHVVGTANASVQLYDFDPSAMSSTVSYVRGLGLIAAKEGNTPTYYHYNAHGDVVQLTDATGAVVKDYTYDAFGVEQNADDTDTNPFRYCGEQYDSETGNYYLRARYYTPGTGRFGQEDPVMDGLNWYAYCGGNPVGFMDPSGCVLVGLRAYAETYKGATVDWDNDTRMASVTYNGNTRSIEGTENNIMNNRIYVDDSWFVNNFGIGGKLIVYQDAVTSNVSIRASFNYSGGAASTDIPLVEGEDPYFATTYSMAFLKGIKEYWNGIFGDYNVSTYAHFSKDGIKTTFSDGYGVSRVSQFFYRPRSGNTEIRMYTGDSRSNHQFSTEEFKWAAAHEFAHVLGLSDAYRATNKDSITSITNASWFVCPQGCDIEKALAAWDKNKVQKW